MAWLAGVSLGCRAQGTDGGFHLEGMVSRMVPVTVMKMTNLVFPVAVANGVKVSRDILAQKPKGVENVIELKAVRRDFAPTNLSVYGMDGRLYSFDLRYVDDSSVLNFRVVPDVAAGTGATGGNSVMSDHPVILTSLPVDRETLDTDAAVLGARSGFLHRSSSAGGVRLRLRAIYLKDSLMWICLRVSNGSEITWRPEAIRVFMEDRGKVKRTATQWVPVEPVYSGRIAVLAGNTVKPIAIAVQPFVLGKGKRLVVEFRDADGGRDLELKIKARTVLRARKG
jgi:conjugative transposon TraN protein